MAGAAKRAGVLARGARHAGGKHDPNRGGWSRGGACGAGSDVAYRGSVGLPGAARPLGAPRQPDGAGVLRMLEAAHKSGKFTPRLFRFAENLPNLRNEFMKRSPNGRTAELLHKFVTVFDTEAESAAFSSSAGMRSARASGAAPAAPAGGAQSDWGRGCGNFGKSRQQRSVANGAIQGRLASVCCRLVLAMVVGSLSVLVPRLGSAQAAQEIAVPSGQEVRFSEVLLDEAPGELWARFRFVAPQITAGGLDQIAGDFDYLCTTLAQPYLAHHGIVPARVAISLSSRDVAFGSSEGDVTQFFETYRLDGGACVWEGF